MCNKEGRNKKYFRIFLPPYLGDKYNLQGPVDIIEDENNSQLIIKKHASNFDLS